MKEQLMAQVRAADEHSITAIAQKRGIPYPNHCLGFFESVYAKCEDANKNGVRLNTDAVKESLNTLIGTQCNLNHFRKGFICGTILDAWLNENSEIVIAFSFFKDVYPDEWERAGKLMEQGKLSVSFELWSDPENTVKMADGTRLLNKMEFIGVGLLLDEKPAYPGAKVFQMAKEAVLNLLQTSTLEPVFAKQIAEDCKDILEKVEEIDEEGNMIAKKLTTEERKALPDDDFAVVVIQKKANGTEKKIRKFPIHDESHVRSALQRLSQDKVVEDLKKLGVNPDDVLKKILQRAKKLNMTTLLETHKEDLKRLNLAMEGATMNPEVMCEDCQWKGMGADLKDGCCPSCGSKNIVELDEEGKCKPKKDMKKADETATVETAPVADPTVTTAEVVVQENVNQQTTTVMSDNGDTSATTVTQTQTIVESNGQPVNEEQTFMIRQVKYTAPQMEEKMAADEAMIAELTAKNQELTASLEAKNKELEVKSQEVELIKANAVKLVERKAKLSSEFSKDWSDVDYLNDDKFEVAMIKQENENYKKENAELKAKVNQPSKPETTIATVSTKKEEVASLKTGHTEEAIVEDAIGIAPTLRSVIKANYKAKK